MDLVPHGGHTASRHPVLCGWCSFIAAFTASRIARLALGHPWRIAFMGLVSGASDQAGILWIASGGEGRKHFPAHGDRFPQWRSGAVRGIDVQVVIMAASVVVVLARRP